MSEEQYKNNRCTKCGRTAIGCACEKDESSFAVPQCSEEEAYELGKKCGESPTGGMDENPYGHGYRKKRAQWLLGFLKGGEKYLQEKQPPNSHKTLNAFTNQ